MPVRLGPRALARASRFRKLLLVSNWLGARVSQSVALWISGSARALARKRQSGSDHWRPRQCGLSSDVRRSLAWVIS